MKQLLLRVPDELHARLAAQAKAKGISLNALANQVLGLSIDPTTLSRRDQLQLKLIALGTLGRKRSELPPETVPDYTPEEVAALRERAIESMRGAGPMAKDLIDYERDPR